MPPLSIDRFEGYDLFVGNEPLTDVLAGLREFGALKSGQVYETVYPKSIAEEEAGLAQLDVVSASGIFTRNRLKVIGALRAIAGSAMDRHEISRENGCDFGCGATGFMVHNLLDGRIQKNTWREIDVHPAAVEANRKLHPGARVDHSSYHRVPSVPGLRGSLNVATGLSSLDATQFVPEAVESIGSALQSGGIFLHIQDVRPGGGVGTRAMRNSGIPLPYQVEVLGGDPTSPFMSFVKNAKRVSVGELFRQEIGAAIRKDPSLELLENSWVTAKKRLPSAPGSLYYLNICLGTSVPFEEASAVVTVARKK